MEKSIFTVYADGIWDLAHPGHRAFLNKVYEKGVERAGGREVRLLIGVNDEGVAQYKREPIMSAAERCDAVRALIPSNWNSSVFSEGVEIVLSKEFMDKHSIDLVVHGDDFNALAIREFYGVAARAGRYAAVPYTPGISTSKLITAAKVDGVAGMRLLGIEVNQLSIPAETLVQRIQIRDWKVLALKDPALEQTTAYRVQQWMRNLDQSVFQAGYRTAVEHRQDPTRLSALYVGWSCLKGVVVGGSQLGLDLLARIGSSIYNRRNDLGNPQFLFARTTELVKNIAGVVLAPVIGLYSPSAASCFGVQSDDYLVRKHTPDSAADLYAIGYLATSFLDRHGIAYRMTSGTFLGAIRNGGEIPHDDDMDFMLDPDAKVKMKELVDNGTFARETGLTIRWQPRSGGWQAYWADGEQQAAIMGGTLFPFIDLFCTRRNAQGLISYEHAGMRALASEEYFTPDEWNNSKLYTFGPLKIRGPVDPSGYFERCFGKDALNFAYQTIHHTDFRLHQWPQRVQVQPGRSLEYNEARYLNRIGVEHAGE